MGYTKLNLDSIRKKTLSSNKVKNTILSKATKTVEKEKAKLIDSFSSHPVTKEIEEGAGARNSSGTLGGYGNLFSFIGFQAGSSPTEPVKELLNEIQIKNIKQVDKGYDVTVKYPSQAEVKAASPLPFENGRSWVEGIEKGISGFTQYIFKKFLAGRSKEGLQSKYDVRGANFQKTNYLFSMLKTFSKNIRGGNDDYSV